jgi:hypothetical protein
MSDNQITTDAAAQAVYAVIRELRNPFGKTWRELTELERDEPRRLARAALEASNEV